MNFSPASMSKTDFQHCAEGNEVKAQPFVGNTTDSVSADSDREEQIRQAGLDMQSAYWRYETSGCFAALGEAHHHRLRMTELIKGRSPEYVAQLEQERGLA